MEIIYSADIEVISRDGAGQIDGFIAHMTERTNPWRVGSEREYKLSGRLVAGMIEAAYMDRHESISAAEMAAIERALPHVGATHFEPPMTGRS